MKIKKNPSANHILFGLRSIGYSFSTAVADIIDNSISAHAKNIWVDAEPADRESYLYVLDDGFGMTKEKLEDAMAFGSSSEHNNLDPLDLGRFGLGLNTASLSQCRKFYVLTKKDNEINGAFWDADELDTENEWYLNVIDNCEMKHLPGYSKLLNLKSGTLVIWKNFDKLISISGTKFESSFRNRVASAKKHCELVFHRFYEEIQIYFNDARINKRDPFLEKFDNAQHKEEQSLVYESSRIKYQAHILPHTSSLTDEEKDLIGGVNTMKTEQGFYLYRNKRLIIWGNWLYMNSRSEFFKLARIRVDIPTKLDFVWNLDVKKTSASIPDSLRDQLWAVVNDASNTSIRTYKYKGEQEYAGKIKVWLRTKTRDGEIKYEINTSLPLIAYLKQQLDEKNRLLFDTLLDQIVSFLPKHQLNLDINDTETKLSNGEEVEDLNDLINQLGLLLAHCPKEIRELMCNKYLEYENYVQICDKKDEILKKADEYDTK